MASFVGTAGDHFTAGELSRLGFLVTLTRGNAPGIDILAYHPETRRTVALQVKTAHRSNQPSGKWMMNAKDSDEAQLRSQAFVLVRFGAAPSPPEFSIVRSLTVARQLHRDHSAWVAAPGARGQARSNEHRAAPDGHDAYGERPWVSADVGRTRRLVRM